MSSDEFYSGVIQRMLVSLFTIAFFLALFISFLYKPVILFYLIVIGMLAAGGLMLYFLFPEFHQKLFAVKQKLKKFIEKHKS